MNLKISNLTINKLKIKLKAQIFELNKRQLKIPEVKIKLKISEFKETISKKRPSSKY